MSSLRRVLALAAFEARLSRRMVRTWILGTLCFLLSLVVGAYYLALHALFSGYSGSWAYLSPEFYVLESAFALGPLLGLVGIFFVFDWRHRDIKAAFAPTLDALPVSRLEHAWGKFLGFSTLAIVPFAILFVLQVVASVVTRVHVAPSTFLLLDLLYGLPFALVPMAISFGLAGLFRNQAIGRAVAVAGGLGWLALALGSGFAVPERIAVVLGSFVEIPIHSDFIGYPLGLVSWLQRLEAWVLLALGVSLASLGPLGLPASGKESRHRVLVAGTLAGALLAILATIAWSYEHGGSARKDIVAAERSFVGRPEPRVVRRDLEVTLDGRRLTGVARLGLRNDTAAPLTEIHLRLNSGLRLTAAEAGGQLSPSRRETMITLALPAPLAPGATVEATLHYEGSIEPMAIDAEEALATREASGLMRGNRRLTGDVPAILERGSVVLGVESGWAPDVGPMMGRTFPDRTAPDLAPGSLVVHVPQGWTPASVGERHDEVGAFRFVSDVPVPGFPLVAARYAEVDSTLDVPAAAGGTRTVTVRVLHHPAHSRNIDFFSPAGDEIRHRVQARLEDVRARTGLVWPYPELTLAEVPQQLAVYGPGWDSPNRMGQPGLLLAREDALFGARFEHALKAARDEAQTGGAGAPGASGASASPAVSGASASPAAAGFDENKAKADLLARFDAADFTGGDLERVAVRSLWDHRVRPQREGLPVLAGALPAYVAEVALGRASVDSPETTRILSGPGMGEIVQATLSGDTDAITGKIVRAIVDLDDVYDLMQREPLSKIDPHVLPAEYVGVMYVKGRQPLAAIREALGPERFAAVLSGLVGAPDGALTWDAFRRAVLEEARVAAALPDAYDASPALTALLDTWQAGTSLPGYVVTSARTVRLSGADERWQVVVRVANRGTAPGMALVVAGKDAGLRRRLFALDAGAEVEVGLVTTSAPLTWRLSPYLALNRTSPSGTLSVQKDTISDEPPFEGVRPAPASTAPREVVVDNLDAGFTLRDKGADVAYSAPGKDGKGHRLASWGGFLTPKRWVRWRSEGAWYHPFGVYDETAALRKLGGKGKGVAAASWTADVPGASTWRVEAYLPKSGLGSGPKLAGTFTYVVHASDGDHQVPIEPASVETGWVGLGSFTFDGKARVELLDEGTGVVVADAVRFVEQRS